MKIDLGTLDPRALPEARGIYQVVQYRGGLIVKKWPKKRGSPKTPGDWYHTMEFGTVAAWVSRPHYLDYGTAVEFAKGTEQIPRDILMMCAYGLYFDVYLPDGQLMPKVREMSTNAQFVLDQITEETGALVWRSPIGWIGLPPGNNGQVLSLQNQGLIWADVSGGQAGGAPALLTSVPTGAENTGAAAKGHVFYPRVPIQPTRLEAYGDFSNTASYHFEIWSTVGISLTSQIYIGPSFTPAINGLQSVNQPIETLVNLEAGIRYVALFIRDNGTDTTSPGIYQSNAIDYGFPVRNVSFRGLVYKKFPVSGDLITINNSGAPFCISMECTINWP